MVWIDCEMTGLELDKDALVEVAVIITDEQLNLLDSGIDIIISPRPEALANMGDYVRKMHTDSGLLDELEHGVPLAEAQTTVLDYIRRFVPEPNKAVLAGNSVGTDKAFLEQEMPDVIKHLHYRIVDVSSIKELARRWYPRVFFNSPPKQGGHRALADIQESILELKYYRAALFPADEGPSSEECKALAAQVLAAGLPTLPAAKA